MEVIYDSLISYNIVKVKKIVKLGYIIVHSKA